jgi:preprotein translocase subunit SecE
MATDDKTSSPAFNKLKWLVVLLVIIAAIVGNVYFGNEAVTVRATVLIVVAIVVLLIAKTTTQGGFAWGFLRDSRTEMRKVVWPTRQETIQTTALVIGVVALMSLILWGIDSIFAVVISGIIG